MNLVKLLLLICILSLTGRSQAQDLFFVNEDAYSILSEISYETKNKDRELTVTIAKNESRIIFAISTEAMTPVSVKGKLLIYLKDASTVSCIDRKIYDYVDNIGTTVYYLTESELKKIDEIGVNTIRFSIKCIDCLSSSEEGSFTATEKEFVSEDPIYMPPIGDW